ncbi:MAG: TlpA family protein disulfide reductase [Leptospirales bacterium]|nr:TlpA family protein disulfide reductase [Leptospirales bacterium]
MPLKKTLLLVPFLLGLAVCRPQEAPNFGVDRWAGRLLDGTAVRFADTKAAHLVINFYSPTCEPCIQEIPALELLSEEAKRRNIPMYMALEGNPASHGLNLPAGASMEDSFDAIRNRMLEDIQKYSIRLPVLIMDPEFKIDPRNGTVTGTPETLVFSMNPMMLRYNFIGPISVSNKADRILRESRYQFVLEKL